MSKILTTQLTGLLQRIQQSEEESIEETATITCTGRYWTRYCVLCMFW